jgi:hypothetical protein
VEAVTASRAPASATALLRASLDRDAARLPPPLVASARAALAPSALPDRPE